MALCALLAVILLVPAVQAQKLDDDLAQAQTAYENLQKELKDNEIKLQKKRDAGEEKIFRDPDRRKVSSLRDEVKKAQDNLFNATVKAFNQELATNPGGSEKAQNLLNSIEKQTAAIEERDAPKPSSSNFQYSMGPTHSSSRPRVHSARKTYADLFIQYDRQTKVVNLYNLKQEYQDLKNQTSLSETEKARYEELQKEITEKENDLDKLAKAFEKSYALQMEKLGETIDPLERQDVINRAVQTKNEAAQIKAPYQPCNNSCAPKCYYKELQVCSFCPLFKTIFNTASVIAQHAINTFSGSIIKVVIIAFGIWIAMQILAFVATPETRDLKDLASALITQSFIVMLVVLILEGGAMAFFNYALTPVYTTGQNIAQAIIKPNDVSQMETKITETDQQKSSVIAACSGGEATGIYDPEKGKGALPKAMGDSIICTMTLIQNRTAQIKALGSASLCMSWEASFVWLIPHLNYLFIGLGLWISAMVMLLAVPFMMIDVVFELGVAAAMLPFAIGSYAFKITRGYTKKVWETFLNSVFKFIFVSLAALMLIVAFQEVITGSTGDLSYMFKENASDAVLNDLLDKLPWFSTHFLKLIFVMILAWSVLSATLEFAGEFAGSISETSIGSQIGTMAGSFTKSAATKILEPTLKATGRHLWSGAKAVAVAPVHLTRRAVNNRRAEKIQKYGKVNAEGNMELASKHWWGDKKLVLMQNTDGSKSIRKDKIRQTSTGQVVKSKLMNENFNIRTITAYDKDGKELYSKEKVRLNSSMAQDLLRKDGTVSHDLEKLMVDRSVEGADKINIALAKEVMAQRMPNTKFNIKNHDFVSQKALYEGGKFVGYIETHKDGSKTIIRMNLSDEDKNGRKHLMADFTRIDAKGRGTRLTSDGIINRRQTFVTQDGTVNSAVKQDSVKSSYRLSAHYDKLYEHAHESRVNQAMQYSMFGEEETKRAHQQIFSGHADRSIYEFEVYHS